MQEKSQKHEKMTKKKVRVLSHAISGFMAFRFLFQNGTYQIRRLA